MTAPDTLRFATFLAPEMHVVYAGIVARVGEALGRPATLFVGSHDYDVFERGQADFGFI
jgi:hypothetical protein